MTTDQKTGMKLKITSRAPTRIDLAGGTIDIWPLFTFLKQPTTVNLAIDLLAEARLDETAGQPGKVTLASQDQKTDLSLGWDELSSSDALDMVPPALALHIRLARYFIARKRTSGWTPARDDRFTLSTIARSPAGAGLGGSSTLGVAMIGALATWARGGSRVPDVELEGVALIEIMRDIETTVIQVPAGIQDYYGAAFGGLQSLKWGIGTHQHERLPDTIVDGVEKRLLLFYSGQSRNSGINNWALFKGFIDNPADIRPRFQKLADSANKLETALRASDWEGAGEAIDEEWTVRKTLAKGITTEAIDDAFARARKLGARSGKVCGAGGGGCFFVFVPSGDTETKKRIREEIEKIPGIRALDFQAMRRGLDVEAIFGCPGCQGE